MSLPWMPLDVAAYRKDTAHLEAAEHGAYLLLIMHYWAVGSLPEDDRQLARIAAMTTAQWKRSKPVVQAFFHDGWKHKRIDKELARAAEISSKRAAAAMQRHSKSNASAPANAQQVDTHARTRAPALPPQPQLPEEERSLRSLAPADKTRGTRLPEAWEPTPADRAMAELALGEDGTRELLANFRDYWAGVPGQRGRKTNWDATWRNRVRDQIGRAAKFPASRVPANFTPRPGSKEDTRERTANAFDKLSRYVDAHADDESGGGEAPQANAGLLPLAQPARP